MAIGYCSDTMYKSTLKRGLSRQFNAMNSKVNNLNYICNECSNKDHKDANYVVKIEETEDQKISLVIWDMGSDNHDKVQDYPIHQDALFLADVIAKDVSLFFEQLLARFNPPSVSSTDHSWMIPHYKQLINELNDKIQSIKENPYYVINQQKGEAIIDYLIEEEADRFNIEYARLEEVRQSIVGEMNAGNSSIDDYLEMNAKYRLTLLEYAMKEKMRNFRDKTSNNRRLELIQSDLEKLVPSENRDILIRKAENLYTDEKKP